MTAKPETVLPAKHQAFVNDYLVTRNATQSYMTVYRVQNSVADTNGARLLKNPAVSAAIAAVAAKASAKAGVTVEYILEGAKEVAERCMQRVPVMSFDKDSKRMVQETDAETGEGMWTFDATGAIKALTLLSKHTGGFSDKHQMVDAEGNPIKPEALQSKTLQIFIIGGQKLEI